MKNHRKTKRLHYGLVGVLLAMLVALGINPVFAGVALAEVGHKQPGLCDSDTPGCRPYWRCRCYTDKIPLWTGDDEWTDQRYSLLS